MRFNQVNKNFGDVNNAISEKGNAVQTTGAGTTGNVTSATSNKGNVVQLSSTVHDADNDAACGLGQTFTLVWTSVSLPAARATDPFGSSRLNSSQPIPCVQKSSVTRACSGGTAAGQARS